MLNRVIVDVLKGTTNNSIELERKPDLSNLFYDSD